MSIKKSVIIGAIQVLIAIVLSCVTLYFSLGPCPEGAFPCDSNTKCIVQSSICNGALDCIDQSDESPIFCGMFFGSKNITQAVVNRTIERNNSEAEKLYIQEGKECLLPVYSDERWICDRWLMKCMDCALKAVPKDLPLNVTTLVLANNEIQLEDSSFEQYTKLKYINLRNNCITDIPEKLFMHENKIKRLYFNENNLSRLPVQLFTNTRQLEWLFLERNNFSKLDLQLLAPLQTLTWLELQENSLTLEDEVFPPLLCLRELDLSYNNISTLSEHLLKNLHSLERLWISDNIISYIHPEAFTNLESFMELKLSRNQISNVNLIFVPAKQLEALYLDFTNIKITKAALQGVNVSYLNLEGIKSIDIDFDVLNNMKALKYIVYNSFYDCFMTPMIHKCKPNNDGISSMKYLLQKSVLHYSALFMVILICLGNIFVLWGRFTFRDENKAVGVVIRNLAVSDILMGLYLAIICIQNYRFSGSFVEVAHAWITSKECILLGMLAMISSEVSMLILTFMSIERFLLISNPFGQHRINYKNIVKCMFTIWLIGILLAVLPAVHLRSSTAFYGHYTTICFPLFVQEKRVVGWKHSAVIFLGINSLLLLVITILYSSLVVNILKTRMAAQNLAYDYEFVVRFFFIVITDSLCWIPITILKAITLFSKYDDYPDIYAWIVIFILPLNSAVNPFLYTFTTPRYREKLFSRKMSKGSDRNIKTKESNRDLEK